MGIDSFVLAHTGEYDTLIEELKLIHISESESIRVIETDQRIYNQDTIQEIYEISF